MAAPRATSQRRGIEILLLAETPLIIPYFIDGLTATTTSVHGVNPTSISQIFLGQPYKS